MRITAFLLLALTLVLPARADEPTKIEFWHGMSSAQGRCVNEMVEAFNKSQKKYEVTSIYQGQYNTLSQKLIASCYAGHAPALSQVYPSWALRFYSYGYMVPVEELMKTDQEFRDKDIPDFYPVMLEENTLQHPKKDKPELVTLPFNKSVYVMFVNQTKMEAAGWKEPPKTWAQFRELATLLTVRKPGSPEPTTYGFGTRPNIEDLTIQAFSAGVQLADEKTNTININSPEVVGALDHLHNLVSGKGGEKIGYVEPNYLNNAFGAEKLAMYFGSTASFSFNDAAVGNKFIWRAYPVPSKDENTQGKTLMQGTSVGIFSGLSEDQQKGAWEFLKFLTGPEMAAKWAFDTGYMPIRKSARNSPLLAGRIAKDPSFANALGTLDRATFEPRYTWWESTRNTLNREVEAVMLDRKKTVESMDYAQKETEAARRNAE